MTKDLTTLRISEHLEKYVFDKIWNDPYTEYRTFTVLECLTEVATAGVFFGRYSQVQMPSDVGYKSSGTNSFFYVYAVPAAMFRSLRLNILSWQSLDKFCTDNLIDIEVFHENGRRCVRSAVFLKQADMNDCMLVAIEKTGFHTCFGDSAKSTDKLIFGEMYDSDNKPSVKYSTLKLKLSDIPGNVHGHDYNPVETNGVPTYATYNGNLLTGDYAKYLAPGALVEKVFDDNIVGYVDVPACGMNAPLYEEKGTLNQRLLVHIPKSLNEGRVVITPNTCDLYLVPSKLTDGYCETSGVYLYQCGRGEYFHQITHNDFGIDKDWLDSVAKANGFDEYYVRMFVRILDQEKTAIRDANYINILYTHTDDEIVAFLLGKSTYPMEFWTASSLETGLYGKATLRRRSTGAGSVADYSLENYIDLIGYYHTLALIGKRVTHFEVTAETKGTKEFVVRAPLALQEYGVSDYFAVVYLNGYRVDQSNITLMSGINADNVNCKELTFTPDASWWTKVIDVNYSLRIRVIVDNVPLKVGDKVVIELLDNQKDGSVRHYKFTDDTNAFIQMKTKSDWKVYQCYNEEHKRFINVTYQPIDNPGEFDEQTMTLALSDRLLGLDLVVVEGNVTLEDSGSKTIDDKIDGWMGNDMWRDPTVDYSNYPMDNEIVFMNDRRLVRGLDYTMEGYTPDTFHAGAKLYLQNVSYLRPENRYQVIRTNQMTLSSQRGFLRGNIVYWNHQNPFWFDELSILSIDGIVCSNIVHEFGTITLLDRHDNGVPFEFRMTVSSKIKGIVGNYGERVDNSKLEQIKAYFDSRYTPPHHQTIVKKSHKIYSLYLEQILTAYFNDPNFDFQLTPSDIVFEQQFADFSDWKRRDVAYSLSPEDLKYVDIYPIFNRLKTENRYQYHKITQLAKRLLPSDKIKHKDATNVK